VARRRREAKAFLAHGDGGVVYGLDVDAPVFQEEVGSLAGDFCVADEDGDDVAGVRHHWDAFLD